MEKKEDKEDFVRNLIKETVKKLNKQTVDEPDIHSTEVKLVESSNKMGKKEALEIICMIADGLNPYKEKGPDNNLPEQHPATIRAICTAIASLITDKNK